MPESKSSKILKIWESHHGKLDDKWRGEFFRHPAMERLKTFEIAELNEILTKEQNLSKVLEILEYNWSHREMDKWRDHDYGPGRILDIDSRSDTNIVAESE